MTSANLFDFPSAPLSAEQIDLLLHRDTVRIERILSQGQASPSDFWYDQDEDEFVVLLQGEALLELCNPDEQLRLRPGDHLTIAAHRRHRVAWTHPHQISLWLAIFVPPISPAKPHPCAEPGAPPSPKQLRSAQDVATRRTR